MFWNKIIFVTHLRRLSSANDAIREEAQTNLYKLWEQDKPQFDKLRTDITKEYRNYPQYERR
jgi:oligoendopeptidase F